MTKEYFRYEPDGFGGFILQTKHLKGRWENCFLTPEEATEHFKASKKIAEEKRLKIIERLSDVKKEVGDFTFNSITEALDDTGLWAESCLVIEVNGYVFQFEIS